MSDETIIERKDGVTVSIELKRGTGTRDQDTVYVKGHYSGLMEAENKRPALHRLAHKHAMEARQIQPDADPEADDTEDLDNE